MCANHLTIGSRQEIPKKFNLSHRNLIQLLKVILLKRPANLLVIDERIHHNSINLLSIKHHRRIPFSGCNSGGG
jgi:hypothetical protein